MKKLVYLIVAIFGAALVFPSLALAEPVIKAQPIHGDLGLVETGKTYEFFFELNNAGDEELVITGLTST